MKKMRYKSLGIASILGCTLMVVTSCDRDLSEDAVPAIFSDNGDIFIDNFIGLGEDFYFPFVPDGAKPDVFSVDDEVAFESFSSIRIDVPNANDPGGNFAGATFVIDGTGRNLTQYDALTFWARSSQSANIGSLGFGSDYRTAISNTVFTPRWTKYIIPIPNSSRLTDVKTVFEFAAGGIGFPGFEVGYTFWIDDLKFESLGNIAQPRPIILNGAEVTQTGFIGSKVTIDNLSLTMNLGSGENVTVSATPLYFDFQVSNSTVASVDVNGVVQILGSGTTEVTAILDGVAAEGSMSFESLGFLPQPAAPTEVEDSVISIFSQTYSDTPASLISDFGAFQTSGLDFLVAQGDSTLNYQNVNFFGIEFNGNVGVPTIDGSEMTNLHLDIYVAEELAPGASMTITLRNAGPNGSVETDTNTGLPIGDDTEVSFSPTLTDGEWISADFDLTGLADRSALGQIVIVTPDAGPANFFVDNIYFYK